MPTADAKDVSVADRPESSAGRRTSGALGLPNLALRVLSAALGLPVIVAAIWFGNPWLPLLLGPVIFGAAVEFRRLAAHSGSRPPLPLVVPASLLFLVNAAYGGDPDRTAALVAGTVALPLVWLAVRFPGQRAFSDWAWTVLPVFYLGWLLSHAVLLRDQEDGRDWLFLTVATTFAVDTFAYFGGRAFGRRKLLPAVSPGKTWEGAVSGLAAGVLIGYLVSLLFDAVPAREALALGAVLGVVAQLGDLAESAIKRSVGVKDTSAILPGHGGLLDRLDSLVFTLPAAYYYVLWGAT